MPSGTPPDHPGRGPASWPPQPNPKGVTTRPVVTSVTPNSDRIAGGAAITITGQNFRNQNNGTAPTVLIGGNAATSVVVVSATSITAVVPPASEQGLVDLSVTINTETGTLVEGFSYYQGFITKVTPAFGPLAGGTAVVLEGFNFVTGSTVLFGTTPGTNVVFIDSAHIAVTSPNHAVGYVDVVVTSPAGEVTTGRNAFKFTLLVRGEDIRRNPGITIRDILNNQPNTATFSIDGTSSPPTVGEEIEITDAFDADRRLFAGTIQSFEQGYEGLTNQLVWNCQAVDFTWLLNRRRPFGVFNNVSASDIVIALVQKFAPGFTTAFVQRDLAPLSLKFTGLEDFSTVLTKIATSIGGGHWYVDYDQDIHFFHVKPPNLIPIVPTTPGPGSGIVLSEDGAMPNTASFPIGYYYTRTSFIYSNGVESSLSPMSNVVPMLGSNQMTFASIPIGADPGGGITVTGRRIYFAYGTNPLKRGWLINDNVTTTFTGYPGAGSLYWTGGESILTFPPPPAPPPPPWTPSVYAFSFPTGRTLFGGTYVLPPYDQMQHQQGYYSFKVSVVYDNGSESQPSPASNTLFLNSYEGPALNGGGPAIPSLNGANPVALKIYSELVEATNFGPSGSINPEHGSLSPILVPYSAGAQQSGQQPTAATPNYGLRPVPPSSGLTLTWPNPDGPYLEDGDEPDDIDDTDPLLLRDPPFRSSEDLSQIRNRVTVLGAATVTGADAVTGDTSLTVAECSIFTEVGGQVLIDGDLIGFFATDVPNGPGTLFLSKALDKDLKAGTVLQYYLQANDFESQVKMGKIELDSDGNPTDGIHESVISDPSLITPQQLYMAANAVLELFSRPIVTVHYATRDPKTRSGKKVNINLTDPPCVGSFLIQEVTIDQIHDDADQLSPRYTVTASSTKYDLNDLLLTIAQAVTGGQGDPAVNLAGIANQEAVTGQQDMPFKRYGATDHGLGSGGGAPVYLQTGLGTAVSSGTAPVYDALEFPVGDPAVVADQGNWMQMVTSTTLNDVSGFTGNHQIRLEANLDMVIYVRTGANISNLIFWAGLIRTGSGVPQNVAGVGQNVCAFRFAPGTDSGWVGVLQQATGGQKVTPLLAQCLPNTVYKLRMRTSGAPPSTNITVSWSVNDGDYTSISYAQSVVGAVNVMPIQGTTGIMVTCVGVVNKIGGSGSTKRLHFKHLGFFLDN